ncbi:glycosyltransferase [Methylobacterium isbiliense]|uniref:Glycosyl transferase family 1 domain-containing protein n=1 Tax=Methylobacterium isbiliense TaxID=315478 RepID=A0ABQ4SS08_9HYPH|nr:glycosyltransferase [Methylobacterium isbiliense]MDN3627917.1 glycosyltransferase [Methylobacterium isbiliense]GJE04613.1 hypothetical protein GMJLKIPL_6577 [Methylobacterium isbiliense]
MYILFDGRALQDEDYSSKGIGQYSLFLLRSLKSIFPDLRIACYVDFQLPDVLEDSKIFFSSYLNNVFDFDGDGYINPSPMTHDTSALSYALRQNMWRIAVVHDFIPIMSQNFFTDNYDYLEYNYLLKSLSRYDLLIANSDHTMRQINLFVDTSNRAVSVMHPLSRFSADENASSADSVDRNDAEEPYVFIAAAQDRRKNIELILNSIKMINSLGLKVVFGGGVSESYINNTFPDHQIDFGKNKVEFTGRLPDEDLKKLYIKAACTIVPSKDEGFSIPVREAISLKASVIGSRIPAHEEQILNKEFLFDPRSPDELMKALKSIIEKKYFFAENYRYFDHHAELEHLKNSIGSMHNSSGASLHADVPKVFVGPENGKKTGIAVFNSYICDELISRDYTYKDVDSLGDEDFFKWLYENQESRIIYSIGNNEIFHSKAYTAVCHVPGVCILHDSRMFEFLLNRYGAWKIIQLHNSIFKGDFNIKVENVEYWQKNRRKLTHSFLNEIVDRSSEVIVHSLVQLNMIKTTYNTDRVRYVEFLTQMSDEERSKIIENRNFYRNRPAFMLNIFMFGELEATKGCSEIIMAASILKMRGVIFNLVFIGKSDHHYRGLLDKIILSLEIKDNIDFVGYVDRSMYIEYLQRCDVAIQLRYPIFGQVSGPVADCAVCGIPIVTVSSISQGMNLEDCCVTIPDSFSPMHIADAVELASKKRYTPMNAVTPMHYLDKIEAGTIVAANK